MRAPSLPHPYVRNHTTLRVKPGVVVYVGLAEPDKYLTNRYPPGFPWRTPKSSNPRVLVPVRLCPGGVSSLPLSLSAFKALRRGRATLTAPLTPRWLRAHAGLRPYRAGVIVSR